METHSSTLCSELWKSKTSTGPHIGKPASVLLPRRCLAANQHAYLDLPEADGDGGSGCETFDDGAGDEVQQKACRPRGNTEQVGPAPPRPREHGWMWAGRGGLGGMGLRTGGPHPIWTGLDSRERGLGSEAQGTPPSVLASKQNSRGLRESLFTNTQE